MFIKKPTFNNLYKDILELGPIINLDLPDNDFIDLFNVLLLKTKTSFTVVAGLALESLALCDLKNKRMIIKRISLIISSLKDISENEHKELLRELIIAVDNAQESLMLLFEFSEFTTKFTIISKPLDSINQLTYHLNDTIQKTIILTSVSGIFKTTKPSMHLEDKNVLVGLDYSNVSDTEEIKKYTKSITGIEYVKFALFTNNEIVKRARVDFILSVLGSFLKDDNVCEEFTYFVLEMNTIRSMGGIYPLLE